MSKTINFNIVIDDVYVDADSTPVLEDADDVYGVKREDNDDVVVAAGTAMTRIGAGIYRYIFDEPAPGLVYNYSVKWILDGVTNYFNGIVSSDLADNIVNGRYAFFDIMNSRFGAENIQSWASISGDSDDSQQKGEAINAAIVQADEYVDLVLRGGCYKLPFATVPQILKNVGSALAGVFLYEAKGVTDFNPESGGPQHRLQWQKKWAERTLDMIRVGTMKLDVARATDYLFVE